MQTRQFERRIARKVGEFAVLNLLGKSLPRRTRRYMGRVYGNAGYRQMKDITGGNGYGEHVPHKAVVGYVAAQAKKYLDSLTQAVPLPPLPEEQSNVQDVQETT